LRRAQNPAEGTNPMADETYRAVAERLLVEAYGRGNSDVLSELVTPGFIDHALPDGFPPSLEGTRSFIRMLRGAMPDLRYTIEDSFLGGSRLAIRVTGQGTMRGPLLGHTPSGKQATWPEIHVCSLEQGRLTEHWSVIDWLGMFKQLGLMPGVRSIEI
jgi:predicted ester cyclase